MRRLLFFIVIVAVLFTGISFAKDIVLKAALENGVRNFTGVGLTIDKFHISFLKGVVDIGGMKIFNPSKYSEPYMANIPHIYININAVALLKGEIHLRKAELEMSELNVIRSPGGDVNVNDLNPIKSQKRSAGIKEEKKGFVKGFQIDELRLKVGQVVYKDYTRMPPTIIKANINIDETYEDISDPSKLVSLIMYKTLIRTSINRLIDLDLGGLREGLTDIISESGLEGAKIQAEKAIRNTTEQVKGLLDKWRK